MLAITLGDPHSVNIELVSTMLGDAGPLRAAVGLTPVVLIGSAFHWRDQTQRLGANGQMLYRIVDDFADAALGQLSFIDVGEASLDIPAERLSPRQRGTLAVRALEALRHASHGHSLAVVTAPIDKAAAASAGFKHPGQTEFFEELWQGGAIMLLAGPRLRVGLVTNHLPLARVTAAITRDLVVTKGTLLAHAVRDAFGVGRPRIGILALNPHAGDGGLFGREDETIIAPAVASLGDALPFAKFQGPLPADTAFYRALSGDFDAVLAMYHDQGLGPLKTVHFDDAVNISAGLRNLRVSPDHGPAADLFLKKRASGKSMTAALTMAVKFLAASHA